MPIKTTLYHQKDPSAAPIEVFSIDAAEIVRTSPLEWGYRQPKPEAAEAPAAKPSRPTLKFKPVPEPEPPAGDAAGDAAGEDPGAS
ncbi:hypothetical protein [Blastochloris tepida]|uniref:Uncharacterized protein n=1 Tax=Blastochloris tepida TaxID=2233851 RepID=A0A348FZA7_9HYPH|nr:hypothetical protein [Blastochloris tepida]BBF92640.1 hypothetical protein BLTE_13250 [Blastochloris tepida]